ncbi:DUF3604 domain-containing protein [Pseudoteredinibacter isoporae]|nr:DUF3604 domain-containing protein [Pseudoteredinibacter isoporae]NIB23538.1 DUF3604 domain-containing protein [Pseudoteredinibacter isoporae]
MKTLSQVITSPANCYNFLSFAVLASSLMTAAPSHANAERELLWGDTHLHTSYSFDAYLNQNKSADPDTAYRWAKGQWVTHPYTKARIRINTPLDFLVVSDHAEVMGVLKHINENEGGLGDMGWWGNLKRWLSIKVIRSAIEDGTGAEVFLDALPKKLHYPGKDPVLDPGNPVPNDILGDTREVEVQTWHAIVDSAERHNQPGKFTTFMGWEWSSIPAGANIHRIVLSPSSGEQAKQYKPFSFIDSPYPEDLWAWLDKTQKETGSEFIAIPHNSNISKGYMFDEKTLRREDITADYARTRMEWEPIVEITQIKGDSEAHPSLSPDDQFAGFEPFDYYLQTGEEAYKARPGDYVRTALGRGLALENKTGVNPYKFGVIGSTDAHTGLASAEEENFWGKMAYDSIPGNKAGGAFSSDGGPKGWDMAAQGLAAVWADGNDRQSIFQAMRRKEVYASTGPRMSVRFFAGWGFNEADVHAENFPERGYQGGVPMGGDLYQAEPGKAPRFIIRAAMDPKSKPLERIEVIKGWLDTDGNNHERIYTVAASDNRELPERGQLAAAEASLLKNGDIESNVEGARELLAYWQDPDFNANQKAFYYLRVFQTPSMRHSAMDAQSLQTEAKGFPELIQERAYSSAVWYNPGPAQNN